MTGNDRYQVPCDQSLFKDVKFLIDGHWYTISPAHYLNAIPDDSTSCRLAFVSGYSGDYLMGTPFFEGYYAEHNFDT